MAAPRKHGRLSSATSEPAPEMVFQPPGNGCSTEVH